MFGFTPHTPERTANAIIDIGSGSVGVAIVISDVHQAKPEIVWSHREYVLIKDITTTEVPLKEIRTSLINAFLRLGADGIKALTAHTPSLKITHVHTTIAAPWSYTITKTVQFKDENPFDITSQFIEELSTTASKQALATVLENEILQEHQLEIIDNQTTGIRINGYPVHHLLTTQARKVSLAHTTAITQKRILSVLEESAEKILPKATLTTHSFMFLYYSVLSYLNPDTTEACIIDITSEATEIGIIREGILTHTTHTAFGTFSIAREIAAICSIPKEEAYAYLKGDLEFVQKKLSPEKLTELEVLFSSYEDKLTTLFKDTGDTLTIPKTMFLHTEIQTEAFFSTRIKNAAHNATGIQHNVHPVTSLLFDETDGHNTALLLSAHKVHHDHTTSVDMDT